MMTIQELAQCANADIATCDPSKLVDLKKLTIDPALPVSDRMNRFLEQVRNPYLFKVDGIVVKVHFAGAKPLSASLAGLLIPQ